MPTHDWSGYMNWETVAKLATTWWAIAIYSVIGLIVFLALLDRVRGKSAIIRNFPIVGHIRYWLIAIGPELRQYLVASNREEKPFNRNERQWIEHSADGANNYFGFGTDNELYSNGYWIIKQSAFPYGEVSFADKGKSATSHNVPSAKVIGEWHQRPNPWRPRSIINISAMSYGSLSGNAIESLNRGAALAGCYHNSGEGGVSRFHRMGADVMYQIGTGMFGCRDLQGRFSPDKLRQLIQEVPQVRVIEIKLSQGAKPGKGGVLPGAKVTPEIAEARGVPLGHDCISPNKHVEFSNVPEMIDFIERVAEVSQRPVGIKSAVGKLGFFEELADLMVKDPTRGPDFITIDGGEGGTGAAPLAFADHVSLPIKVGFPRVYQIFHERGIADNITWIASGKLGFPDRAIVAFAMGADLLHVAREAMISIGCIQAQKCHTNHCPAGIATQNHYLSKAVKPAQHGERLARYIESFRKEVLSLSHAAGYPHPAMITAEDIEISTGTYQFSPLSRVLGYSPNRLSVDDTNPIFVPEIVREAEEAAHARTIRLTPEDLKARMQAAAASDSK